MSDTERIKEACERVFSSNESDRQFVLGFMVGMTASAEKSKESKPDDKKEE